MSHPRSADSIGGGIIGCVLGILVGAGIVWALPVSSAVEQAAYDRGRAQGHRDCKKPSKLEKAAKWLAE